MTAAELRKQKEFSEGHYDPSSEEAENFAYLMVMLLNVKPSLSDTLTNSVQFRFTSRGFGGRVYQQCAGYSRGNIRYRYSRDIMETDASDWESLVRTLPPVNGWGTYDEEAGHFFKYRNK